jgi:hypothetical protein
MTNEELCRDAEERTTGYLKRWLADPEFMKLLRSYRVQAFANGAPAYMVEPGEGTRD